MALEGRKQIGGVERRRRNAPVDQISRAIAYRISDLRVSLEDVFSGESEDSCVRSGDLVDIKLREAVAGVLSGIVVKYVAPVADVDISANVVIVENGLPVADASPGVAESESLEEITAQYYEALGVLRKFGLYDGGLNSMQGDVDAPILGCVNDILKGFTPAQNEVIGRMKKRVLQLIPITSMSRYMRALNGYKPIVGQIDAMVFNWYKCAFARADVRDGVKGEGDSIVGWRVAITEGWEDSVLSGDNVFNTLTERIDWFVGEFDKIGVSGVDLKRMILLMMDSLCKGKPLNSSADFGVLCTIVNGESDVDGCVSIVSWIDSIKSVSMMVVDGGESDEHAVFRPSVMKDAPSP
jgi:hypothetical protein